jgi:hypothetical protein
MFDLLETRLSALGIVCEHESGKLQFTLTDKGLSVDIMVTRPHGATLLFWAAAGFMDTLLRCEDETGGGLWEREGNSAGSSKLKQSSWLRSAV